MIDYRKINNITGWVVFAIATAVYVLTLEPTASFWDCGEFIACSYKLLVPHPPGAPLFLLIGRMFSMLSFGDVTKVAYWVNILSALSSSFTVLFLFWTITILAKRLILKAGETITTGQTLLVMGSGVVGALAFTFSDSFWFSAVEAEVYAMSSFFTAFVVWAMLKWSKNFGDSEADKWLILIAYMVGLSIGVHLLNLVAIPALAFIYYFRVYKPNLKGGILAFIISALIVGFILVGVIPGLPSLAGNFELFFVNNLGMPFGSGIIVFMVALVAAIVYALRYSYKKNSRVLNTAILSFIFILIGYSSYMIIPIRSSYDPTIDENDPENVISFVSYLKREQYGDRPLLYGPQYTAQVIDQKKGDPRYIKGKDKYEIADYKIEPVYDPKHMSLLPRIWSSQPHHVQEYKKWVDLRDGQRPTMGQNLSFMMQLQFNHMYWRYFLWNFVGREGDVQQSGVLWPFESDKDVAPRMAESKARNNFYMLPLILGVVGLVFQLRRNEKDAFIVGLLFVFTGLAIIFYLNAPPVEPRERDYAYAGSYYAFAIWIGLGVMGVAAALNRLLRSDVARGAVATLVCLSVPGIMAAEGWDDHDRSGRYHSVDSAKNLLSSCAPNAILFTNGDNDTFPLWYAQEVEGFRTDVRVAVLSYLNTDWYVDQMKRQAYKSDPLPISLENVNYRQGTNDYLPYVEKPQVRAGMDLKQYIQLVKENHRALQIPYQDAKYLLSFPTKNFFLNIDKQAVANANFVPAERQKDIVDRMNWTINKSALEKKHLVILDILTNNNWKRPVYFSTTVNSSDQLGLQSYFQLEGLAYRVVPYQTVNPGGDVGYMPRELNYQKLVKEFQYRNLDDSTIFYDENYLRFPANVREKFNRLAIEYLNDGNTAKAKEVMDFCFKVMPGSSIPYDYYTPQFIEPLVRVGEEEKAREILTTMGAQAVKSLDYYFKQGPVFDVEIQTNMFVLQQVITAARQLGMNQQANEYEQKFMGYWSRIQR